MSKQKTTGVVSTSQVGNTEIVKKDDGSAEILVRDLAVGSTTNRDNTWETVWADHVSMENMQEGLPSDGIARIKKAMQYYDRDAIVSKSVDLLSQLANDGFKIRSEKKEIEDFYKKWWIDIKGYSFLTQFFKEYFRSANIYPLRNLVPYKPKNKDVNDVTKRLVEANAKLEKEYEDAKATLEVLREDPTEDRTEEIKKWEHEVYERKIRWTKQMIPASYTILNPTSVKIEGPESFPELQQMRLNVDEKTVEAISNQDNPMHKFVVNALPADIVWQVKDGKQDSVVINPIYCNRVTRGKQDYEKYATPLCAHAFESLDYKYELREMDKSTVRSVRNRILKVTIGNDMFPVTDETQLKALARTFNNPSRDLTIFWNHTLQIQYIEPDLDSLNKDKYESPNEEIRACFGVSKVLTGNENGSIGNNVLNLKGLIELLDEAQQMFLEWFREECQFIARSLDMKDIPEAEFGKLNMKDENKFITVILQMLDRQLISYETAMETLGHSFPREVKRLESEFKIRKEKEILMPIENPNQMSGRPENTDEGDRPESKDEPKDPKGEQIVSSVSAEVIEIEDPDEEVPVVDSIFDLEDMRNTIYQLYKDRFKQAGIKFKTDAKTKSKYLTSKRKQELSRAAWASVIKDVFSKYNIECELNDVLDSAYSHVADMKKKYKNREQDVLMSLYLAHYVLNNQ